MTIKSHIFSWLVLAFCLVLLTACSDDTSGVTSVHNADESDFFGEYSVTDPNRTYEEYHGTIRFLSDMTFTAVDVFYESYTASGVGRWSFDQSTVTFWMRSEDDAEFSGPIVGNVNDFTLHGHWSNGREGTARFIRQ